MRETMYALASLGADHADLLISCRRILGRHPAAGPLWAACARLVAAADPARLAWDLVDRDPVDIEAVARHLPTEVALLAPTEWADEAVVAAAVDRGADADRDDVGDGILDPMAADRILDGPIVPVVDDGSGSAGRLHRTLVRHEVGAVLVGTSDLGGTPIVFEPSLVAVGAIIAPTTVAATVADLAGSPVWAAISDDDVLPRAFGAEALARIADDPEWAAIDLDLVAGVVGASGRRPVGELTSSVPLAPELLRAPI